MPGGVAEFCVMMVVSRLSSCMSRPGLGIEYYANELNR